MNKFKAYRGQAHHSKANNHKRATTNKSPSTAYSYARETTKQTNSSVNNKRMNKSVDSYSVIESISKDTKPSGTVSKSPKKIITSLANLNISTEMNRKVAYTARNFQRLAESVRGNSEVCLSKIKLIMFECDSP